MSSDMSLTCAVPILRDYFFPIADYKGKDDSRNVFTEIMNDKWKVCGI
jgi:hypothetical protein